VSNGVACDADSERDRYLITRPNLIQPAPSETPKDRTETGQTLLGKTPSRLAKTHQDYWKARLRRRSYLGRHGDRVEIPEWQVRMFLLNREAWFNLATPNQSAAAIKARDIYVTLVSLGWEATLAKFKPSPLVKASVSTVGEFIADVEKRSHLQPRTVRIYATKLRKLVSDVSKLEVGKKKKAKRAKFGKGHQQWLAAVNAQPLDVLTVDKVMEWRNTYVSRAKSEPLKRKSAERSAASILRAGRALFANNVTNLLKVKLPDNPFVGVKFQDPGPQRYHSDVNPELLLASAERELRPAEPEQYLGLFLCLWAGLRRKEADLLTWAQVDLQAGQIHVRRTAYFEPKTEESQRMIDLGPEAVDVLRTLKKGKTTDFVMDGAEPDLAATYGKYRCDPTWRKLISWIKGKGVRQRNAVHMLRKESGSLVAATYGIEAARQHLGHRDIRTTSAHYVTKKRRIEVRLSPATSLELGTAT
jgi:integrase